jgi:hypothetical protein
MRQLHTWLPEETVSQLRQIATAERRTVPAQIRVLVENEWALGRYGDDDNQKDDAA